MEKEKADEPRDEGAWLSEDKRELADEICEVKKAADLLELIMTELEKTAAWFHAKFPKRTLEFADRFFIGWLVDGIALHNRAVMNSRHHKRYAEMLAPLDAFTELYVGVDRVTIEWKSTWDTSTTKKVTTESMSIHTSAASAAG